MRDYSLHKLKFCYRAALLFGLLAGLLFSCGEGIRLFPFPLAEIAHQANSDWKSNELNAYQKNVYRFEKQQKSQSKSQREIPPNHWAGSFVALNLSPLYAAAADLKRKLPTDFQTAKSIKISASCGSRAPPVSETL